MATGYQYNDKYGISHVVSDYNTAKQYSGNGQVNNYSGSYSGGYGTGGKVTGTATAPSSSSSSSSYNVPKPTTTTSNTSTSLPQGPPSPSHYWDSSTTANGGGATMYWPNGTPVQSSIPQQPPVLPPPIMPQMPTMPTIPPFQAPVQNQMSFDQAQNQVKGQLDPLYAKAVENVRRQQYQNQLNAGQLAQNKGLAHSGLAADLQNKVNLQAQQDISNADADKQAKIAAMAQALQQQDFNNYQNTYSNALNTWMNNSNMAINQYKLGAQLAQWQQEQKQQQDAQDWARRLGLYNLIGGIF